MKEISSESGAWRVLAHTRSSAVRDHDERLPFLSNIAVKTRCRRSRGLHTQFVPNEFFANTSRYRLCTERYNTVNRCACRGAKHRETTAHRLQDGAVPLFAQFRRPASAANTRLQRRQFAVTAGMLGDRCDRLRGDSAPDVTRPTSLTPAARHSLSWAGAQATLMVWVTAIRLPAAIDCCWQAGPTSTEQPQARLFPHRQPVE